MGLFALVGSLKRQRTSQAAGLAAAMIGAARAHRLVGRAAGVVELGVGLAPHETVGSFGRWSSRPCACASRQGLALRLRGRSRRGCYRCARLGPGPVQYRPWRHQPLACAVGRRARPRDGPIADRSRGGNRVWARGRLARAQLFRAASPCRDHPRRHYGHHRRLRLARLSDWRRWAIVAGGICEVRIDRLGNRRVGAQDAARGSGSGAVRTLGATALLAIALAVALALWLGRIIARSVSHAARTAIVSGEGSLPLPSGTPVAEVNTLMAELRKRTDLLRESEAIFRAMFEVSSVGKIEVEPARICAAAARIRHHRYGSHDGAQRRWHGRP
jgi:hypothetical protein